MDLLIRLYDLPDFSKRLDKVKRQAVNIRRARTHEKVQLVEWVLNLFGPGWAGECEMAFGRQPISCLIATQKGEIIGFACHECTCRDFFGPIGVKEDSRNYGVGAALLAQSLMAMTAMGYAYAIVGDGGDQQEFYRRVVEIQPIAGSTPGIYADPLTAKG